MPPSSSSRSTSHSARLARPVTAPVAQDELRDWTQTTIGRSCVAAAPGVFYVFRDTAEEQMIGCANKSELRDLRDAYRQQLEDNEAELPPTVKVE